MPRSVVDGDVVKVVSGAGFDDFAIIAVASLVTTQARWHVGRS